MTISKRIIAGFSAVVAVLALVGGFSLYQFSSVNTRSGELESGVPSLLGMEEMRARTLTNYAQVLRHVLTTDPAQLQEIEASMKQVSEGNSKLNKDYEERINNDTERALFAKYQSARTTLLDARKPVLEASSKNDKKQALALLASTYEPALTGYQKTIDALIEYNTADVNGLVGGIDQTAHFSTTACLLAVATGLGIAVTISFFIIRSVRKSLDDIARQLSEGSAQVASASSQVSASSQSLAQGASEQAASLEESSSSIEEMASMIKKNADTSQQAASLSGEAKTAADRGTEAMDQMNTAITDIERAAGETAKIIKTIDEIAFQTNLLALNAAVEAARAGEAGKGFAVVAEEVRNLAMRSAEAAKNTSSLIEESVNKAKNGVTIAQSVATNLQQINQSTTKVGGLIAEIAAASKEQATGIDQISTAVGQMDKVTQTNAANAEETAAASEELNAQSQQLQDCVKALQELAGIRVTTTATDGPRTARPRPTASRPTTTGSAPARSDSKNRSARELIPLENVQTSSGDFSDFSKAA